MVWNLEELSISITDTESGWHWKRLMREQTSIMVPLKIYSAAPGPVSNIVWTRQTDTFAVVSWGPPERPNGIITGYIITLTEYQGTTVILMNSVGANVTSVDICHNNLGK